MATKTYILTISSVGEATYRDEDVEIDDKDEARRVFENDARLYDVWDRHRRLTADLHSAEVRFYASVDEDYNQRVEMCVEFAFPLGDEGYPHAAEVEQVKTLAQRHGFEWTTSGWDDSDDENARFEAQANVVGLSDLRVTAMKWGLLADLIDECLPHTVVRVL